MRDLDDNWLADARDYNNTEGKVSAAWQQAGNMGEIIEISASQPPRIKPGFTAIPNIYQNKKKKKVNFIHETFSLGLNQKKNWLVSHDNNN